MNVQDKKTKLPRLTQNLPSLTNADPAGAADSGADSATRPIVQGESKEQRSQLRAAIKSAYDARPDEASPVLSHIEQLIHQARQLALKGDTDSKEQAVQLFSQAVALSPTHSDAWMWLGGMLLDQNVERAQYCLERAVTLNPQNERAKRGLASIKATLNPAIESVPFTPLEAEQPSQPKTTTALTIIAADEFLAFEPEVPTEPDQISQEQNPNYNEEMALVPMDAENTALSELPPDRTTKIGLEEAVAVLREAGVEADPETVPLGGAKIREGLEAGIFVVGKKGVREARLYGLRLTITLLLIMAALAGFGLYVLLVHPDFKQAFTQPPTPVPTATPLPDQRAATRLRVSFGNYNRYFTTFQSLTNQAVNGKLAWDDFHRQVSDLNTEIKAESQNVNAIANTITPVLLETFKELQDVAATANTASEYTMSGIEHEQPEDLQAGIRYFNQATSLLADAARKLEQVAPQLTVTPQDTTQLNIITPAPDLLTPTPIQPSVATAPGNILSTPASFTPYQSR